MCHGACTVTDADAHHGTCTCTLQHEAHHGIRAHSSKAYHGAKGADMHRKHALYLAVQAVQDWQSHAPAMSMVLNLGDTIDGQDTVVGVAGQLCSNC